MTQNMMKRAIKAEHFANLVAIAYADNFLDDFEKAFLSQRAEEIGLSSEEIMSRIASAEELKFIVPLNQEEIEDQMADIVYIAMVDGDVHEKEYELCLTIAKKLNYSKSDLDHMIELTRKLWKKSAS